MDPANPAKFVEETRKREETKRRKREAIVIVITGLMVAALIYFEVQLPDVSPESSTPRCAHSSWSVCSKSCRDCSRSLVSRAARRFSCLRLSFDLPFLGMASPALPS